MQKTKINDSAGNIIYWKSDGFDLSRDTLFFLHGLTADHTMFEQQFLAFDKCCNILAWDAHAHGESRPYSDFTYEKAVTGLKNILDECGIQEVVLIGQSMGGYIAQAFICRYPEKMKGFVSIDSTPYGSLPYQGGHLFHSDWDDRHPHRKRNPRYDGGNAEKPAGIQIRSITKGYGAVPFSALHHIPYIITSLSGIPRCGASVLFPVILN